MRRALTFWQVMILVVVFLMTASVYTWLGLWLIRDRSGGQKPPSSQGVVRILAPQDGAALQAGAALIVQAMILEPDVTQVELLVDGQGVGAQVNADPGAAPWTVQWTWQGDEEGAHSLVVRAEGRKGRVDTSAPVRLIVVPPGRLFFASDRQGAYALYQMQTDGQNMLRLTTGPSDAHRPAPRQDGALAFVVEDETGRPVIRLAGGLLTGEEDLVAGTDPAWSPPLPGSTTGGEYLAYAASEQGVSQVFALLLAGRVPRPVTNETSYAGQPAWSPVPPTSGTGSAQLAYVAEHEGNWDIWTVGLDGGQSRRLTDDPAMDWAPAWSPDGKYLAFVSDRGGSHQIYVMRADGSEVHALTLFAQGAESPAWSPDGYWLAFVAYNGGGAGIEAREIYLMSADGGSQVRLTYNAYDDTEVVWVPAP